MCIPSFINIQCVNLEAVVSCVRNNIGNMRKSEENFEEVHGLSPIEEESEPTLCFKEASINLSKLGGNRYQMTKSPYKNYQRLLKKSKGNRNAH